MELWTYAPLSLFSRPEDPARTAAIDRLRGFLQRLRRGSLIAEPVSVQAELRSASLKLLDRVAPSPRWGAAERALESALAAWKDAPTAQQNIQVIIGPSGTGTTHVVRKWAERNGYRLLAPPPYREIIDGNESWLQQCHGDDPLAIPNLECFFLRHHNGLDALRKLLDGICCSARRYAVGCNSWAWSYLTRAIRINALLPQPITLTAFDGPRFQRWLCVLAASSSGRPLSFRMTDDGSHVLPSLAKRGSGAPEGDNEDRMDAMEQSSEPSPILQRLAVRSRGNPLVGWAMWRQCLHISSDEDVEEEAQEAAAADRGRTIWIRPWSQLSFPEMPPASGPAELMLLHALLVHDGLPADLLDLLLPYSLGEIMERLYSLRSAGLVKLENGLWRVTLLGYPAVRRALADEDYLVDEF